MGVLTSSLRPFPGDNLNTPEQGETWPKWETCSRREKDKSITVVRPMASVSVPGRSSSISSRAPPREINPADLANRPEHDITASTETVSETACATEGAMPHTPFDMLSLHC
jgi:hypothetical protein